MKPIERTHTPAEVISLFETRYTAKSYDPERTVSDDDMNAILEAARLSPSSMATEPWHFIVAPKTSALIDKVAPLCWGVHPTPSHYVFILGRNGESFTADDETADDYLYHLHVNVQGRGADKIGARREHVRNLLFNDLHLGSADAITGWVNRQAYLALESMLLASAMLGVDSTPVEGLDSDAVEKVLLEHNLFDPAKYHFIALVTFGYTDRAEHRPKVRRPADEVITYVNE